MSKVKPWCLILLVFCSLLTACRTSVDKGRGIESPDTFVHLDSGDSSIESDGEDTSGIEDTSTDQTDSTESETEDSEEDASGSDRDDCVCPLGQVYVQHECSPTIQLGCQETCVEGSCPPGYLCDSCAASSRCDTLDCQPACVLAYGPHALVAEPLRVWPVSGPEQTSQTVFVSGTPFYIGAIGHRLRVDDQELSWPEFTPVSACRMSINVPPKPTGLYPIWVSQYSGEAPWALSGFYRSGESELCIQPGFVCDMQNSNCCSTESVPIGCVNNVCTRIE